MKQSVKSPKGRLGAENHANAVKSAKNGTKYRKTALKRGASVPLMPPKQEKATARAAQKAPEPLPKSADAPEWLSKCLQGALGRAKRTPNRQKTGEKAIKADNCGKNRQISKKSRRRISRQSSKKRGERGQGRQTRAEENKNNGQKQAKNKQKSEKPRQKREWARRQRVSKR